MRKSNFFIISLLAIFISFNYLAAQEEEVSIDTPAETIKSSSEYVQDAWEAEGKGEYDRVFQITDECVQIYREEADRIASALEDFPPQGKESIYQVMNDTATCMFIKGEAMTRIRENLLLENKQDEAEKLRLEAIEYFRNLMQRYPYAQAWDPRGWYWSIHKTSEITVNKLIKGVIEEDEKRPVRITPITLYDPGEEKVVNYRQYGKFLNEGTENYKYEITDPEGLMKALGEGIYPNTSSVKFDPTFQKIRKTKEFKTISWWDLLNSRDLESAFYKWITSAEPWGVKQFYIAGLLERSGLYEHAVKAYYATVVHFPSGYGWTYWHTPWYTGREAIVRIKYILRNHPELKMEYAGADIKIRNGFDNRVDNDVFIVKPGRIKSSNGFLKRFLKSPRKRKLGKVEETAVKGKRIRLVQYESGDWQLLVDGKPFMIKGITYAPTRVGESPDSGTIRDWMTYDYNDNGIKDSYEVWVDKNKNNARDSDEETVSDFKLLKDMGVNCIRIYKQPFAPDKKFLRKMYEEYDIFVALGDFMGKYALGSGASWKEGTDYDNPEHQKNMLESVKQMVKEYKDEPYILAWILGNENVYGVACNADKKPESFFKFANEVARAIKKIDPNHPVILCGGDALYLDLFGKYCPDIDIYGTNSYRGKYGFGFLWQDAREYADKPVLVTEYGVSAYSTGYSPEESEEYQAEYHRSCWEDMMDNSCGSGFGNSLGGFVFEYLDEWWKAYEPFYHDKKGLFTGPFLDGYMHEEWLGIVGQGDGRHSPYQRVLRKAYFVLKELWNKE